MSIEIIDILKPKNGLSFKLIEDVDIAVQGYESLADAVSHFATQSAVQQIINAALSGKQDTLTTTQLAAVNSGITSELVTQIGTNTTAIAGKASQADLTALETEVDSKADASDLTTATANLQAQIDAIVTPATQDAEVQNARVGADGTSHATLKARCDSDDEKHTQSEADIQSILDEAISQKTNLTSQYVLGYITLTGGIGNTVNTTPSTSTQYKYVLVPCKKGDLFKLTGLGGASPRLWGFTDTECKLLSVASAEAQASNLELTASSDGYFISNVYGINTSTYPYALEQKHYVPVVDEIESIDSEISTARVDADNVTHLSLSDRLNADDEKHTETETDIYNILDSSIATSSNLTSQYVKGYITLSVGVGNTVNPTPSTSNQYSYIIQPCKRGEKFTITGLGGTSPRLWGFTDADYKLLSVADSEEQKSSFELVAPNDGYFISNVYSANTTTYPYSLFFKYYPNVVNEIGIVQEEIDELKYQKIDLIQVRNRYYNAGNGILTYYNGFTCTQLIKVIPGATAFIKTSAGDSVGVAGYNSEKVYNSRILETGGSALYPVERGVLTTKIIIPTDVYYITVSNVAPNDTDIEVTLPNDIAEVNKSTKMLIVPQSSLAFDVYVAASANKYLRHHFVKQYYSDTLSYGDDQTKEVVGADVWYSDVIADGATSVMAGNFNFIHNISNMQGHNGYVGAGHGCAVADWTIFYADGNPIAPDLLSFPMECSRFDFQIKAKNYLIDKPNSPSESHAVPTLDENGEPIVTLINIIDAQIREGNVIEYRNRLIFKMDGIQFSECHGSMCEGYFAAFDNVIISNSEESWNSIDSSDDYSRTKMHGTEWDVFTAGSKKALSVTMFGDNYKVKNELYQVNGARNTITNTRTALYRDNGARMKVYLMPVVTTMSAENIAGGATVETFNSGDILDCISRREISCI